MVGEWTHIQISKCFKNLENPIPILVGMITNLSREQATHENF